MAMQSWSTEAVPARERFAYWREAVCAAVIGADPEAPPAQGFAARIAATHWATGGFATFSASPHVILRTEAMIGRGADAPFLVSLQLTGESHYWDGQAALRVRPGDITVVDTARPFRVAFPRDVARVIAIVPREQPAMRRWRHGPTVVRLSGRGTYLDLARAYLAGARGESADMAGPEAGQLVVHLAELVSLAGARRDGLGARAIGRQALFDYMALNFADPDLSPRHAAAALGISPRLVHRLCAEAGTTFGRWIIERRLEACRDDFDDPAAMHRTASAIAFARGFNDLSHFSRAFKARFGASPRRYRKREERSG
ncbi:MAG: helix-turn-helix domain-containing protein [Rhodospirillaceae bacterium]|nr:helix-turn-helix domain-containing protein [Rhodospirillaceae bacterium]